MAAAQPRTTSLIPGVLRDARVLALIGQVVFALLLIALLYGLATSISTALASRNLTPNLTFLNDRAGFDIGDRPEWYSADSSYWQAYQVGFINTLRVVCVGLVLSTVLGIFIGIFLLSTNWLVRNLSKSYVEILRNTPLLVQLFFWYFVIMLSLPPFQQSLAFPQEGMTLVPVRFALYLIAGVLVWWWLRRLPPVQHERRALIVPAFFAAIAIIEAGFWLFYNNPDVGRTLYGGSLGDLRLWLYLAVSGVIVGVVVLLGKNWRMAALGALTGQLIGGLLFFFGVIPASVLRFELRPAIYVNIRGFAFPEVLPTARFADWLAFVAVGVALAIGLWIYLGRLKEATGNAYPRFAYGVLAVVIFAVVGWAIVGSEPAPTVVPLTAEDGTTTFVPLEQARADAGLTRADELLYSSQPLAFYLPERTNFRFIAGIEIKPEYMALLLGLTIYTSAFIAEIVRAGILAVPRGQLEAARALGLPYNQVLSLVILPQALRVIIPPLGNQYLNLTKNSSLAIAIAYADLFQITTTIMNQSGQSVTGMTMVMLTYLVLSLAIATLMNWVNRRFQIVTR